MADEIRNRGRLSPELRRQRLREAGFSNLDCEQCHQPCGYDAGRDSLGRIVHAHGCPRTEFHVEPRRYLRGGRKQALFDSGLAELLDQPDVATKPWQATEGDVCMLCSKPIKTPGPKKILYRKSSGRALGNLHVHHTRRKKVAV